jgi:acyl transferase domain-containing protein
MLSPLGRSHSFDHRANGYGRGEGFSMVVVRRLSEAISQGNTIRAVVRATGTNHNGRTPNLTSPCTKAQQELIRNTYRSSGLDLGTTAFVEAHGTGTAVGDPIEAEALGSVFGQARAAGDPVYLYVSSGTILVRFAKPI